ncbi:unnamed protein product [Darwinula stevensoni]|uniref:Ubiquitin-conjugating enzyme E2 T n=1 Tax=Darwinula stevensoni TaxID=69355 RepID=A0A7R8XEH2_9CRUS|nr:unnamed protein product [Darwinula stevensoni]CAG0894021.1 unnamed protein product [Darwinula stevensoni]
MLSGALLPDLQRISSFLQSSACPLRGKHPTEEDRRARFRIGIFIHVRAKPRPKRLLKMQRNLRMKRELALLHQDPPSGITCSCTDDVHMDKLQADIVGCSGTPYEGGIFKLQIKIPERYPFQPPEVQFVTPIYHPNIDSTGRICLDVLKMPPKGSWKPSHNIGSVLTSILLLLNEPNPDDPLVTEIAEEFKFSRMAFEEKARRWTKQYASQEAAERSSRVSMATAKGDVAKSAPEHGVE